MTDVKLVVSSDLESQLELIRVVQEELKSLVLTVEGEMPYVCLYTVGVGGLTFSQSTREVTVSINFGEYTLYESIGADDMCITDFSKTEVIDAAKHIVKFLFEEYLK